MITAALELDADTPAAATLVALRLLPPSKPVRATIAWVENQLHALGRAEFTRLDIETVIARNIAMRRPSVSPIEQARNEMVAALAGSCVVCRLIDVSWLIWIAMQVARKRKPIYDRVAGISTLRLPLPELAAPLPLV